MADSMPLDGLKTLKPIILKQWIQQLHAAALFEALIHIYSLKKFPNMHMHLLFICKHAQNTKGTEKLHEMKMI
jgi:hypothetical protein